ncbi:TSUP family transporter [Desulfocurvus sp.]|jgi:hypothetical protein|uniref:TSUP family transporter n=1 Tax=Desulfocurvus sp. TaxID=2871698 RepID=UPI0025B88129|nr:TSUP family transporter [Desulfocurvus sp.]MCK9240442.1 TSUP family transporter [Desulfocurvus sp.]
MTAILTVSLAALGAAGLTLYSGFGLGTLLLPVFALFLPVEAAVGATALVHGANNAFKAALVGRLADRDLVLRFGLPAVLAAFAGAAALGWVAHFEAVARYELFGREATVTPLKLAMAGLMAAFALLEFSPRLRRLRFSRRWLVPGGLLSGFFGGFSGHQGALRSAFLVKVGVSTEAFVGTNAVIGLLVDLARLAVYGGLLAGSGGAALAGGRWPLVLAGTLAAFAGVLLARRFLHKVTMSAVQALTGAMLLAVALALGSGLI